MDEYEAQLKDRLGFLYKLRNDVRKWCVMPQFHSPTHDAVFAVANQWARAGSMIMREEGWYWYGTFLDRATGHK
jgi:hypothetical protein